MIPGNNIIIGFIHVDNDEQLETLQSQSTGIVYFPSICFCNFYALRQVNQ
jgi:hypothetical protein